ncbi:hypothetical protein PVAG01_04410 [Phlyctema vagabunda]|uniref:VWFA domain-containing protein n=1 Tax=Phlyctema vagabunda TaxID=108571 RepID=A0ABR4PP62_9HELO
MLDLSDRRPTAEILWREQLEIINSAEESHKSLSIQSSSRTRDWRQFNSNSGSTRSPKPPLSEPGAIYPPVLPPELRAMSLPNNHGDREISMGLGADTEDGMSSAILINEGIRHSPDEMSMCGEQDWNRPFAMQDQVSLATSNAHPTSTQRVMSPMVRDHRIISGSAWTPNPIGSLHHQTQRSDESNNPIGINGNPGYNKHAASDIRSPLLSPNTPENTHNGLHISYTGTKSSFDLSSLSLDAAHKQNKLYISTHQPALVQPIATVSQVTASTKTMTLEEALDWKSKCKSSDRLAPGLNWNLHNRLKGRDHVFLIDDSSSMEPHWPNLVRVFEALSYIVKQSDENGLDLFFSNSNNCEKDCKKTRKLLPIVRAQKQTQKKITTDINFRLSQILEKHKNGLDRKVWYRSKLKPLSLYILTDGVWETNCTAIDPIRNAVLKLHDLRIPSSQIGIQFISFGSDEVGLNRLAYLDDKLDLPKDIVDTEPWDGNVWKMLLGSINDNFDSQNRLKTLAEVHHNVA